MGLLDPQNINPLAMGLLGAGGAIMSGRRGIAQAPQAFAGGLMQGQQMQQAQRAAAMREQMAAQQMDMQREQFGMQREEFGLRRGEMDARRDQLQQRTQQIAQVRQQVEAQRPELLPLFDLNPDEAIKRMFPDAAKPVSVAPGAVLLDPSTRQEIFRNPVAERPDEFERALRAAGIDPASPQGMQMLQQRAQKMVSHAPAPTTHVHTGTLVEAERADGQPAFVMPSREGRFTEMPGIRPPGTAAADQARERSRASALDTATRLRSTTAEAIAKVSPFSTGGVGAVLARLPATDARDLRALVETLQANLSFEELRKMREASPTGGALGGIAVRELDLLGATVANLDANQSPTQLLSNLRKVDQHFATVQGIIRQGRQGSQGAPAPAGEPAAPVDLREAARRELERRGGR